MFIRQPGKLRNAMQHGAGLGDDGLAHRGQQHSAAAFYQGHPKLLLQLPHLGGERRLGDETGRRRPPEVAMLRHRHQILEIPEIHRSA